MFKLKVADARFLRDVINAILTLIEEATFHVSPDGIRLRTLDPSKVAMVDFELPKEAFDEYVCSERVKIGVNLSELLKLLKRAGRDEYVELSFDKKSGRLKVSLMGKYARTFNMPTLEAEEEEVPTPRVTFNVKAEMRAGGLNKAIEDASLVSDHVKLEADDEKLILRATGDLMGAIVELKKGSEALLNVEAIESSKATFSLNYLSEIVKAASATSDVVTLEFSTDMPIKLDFKQPKGGKLVYYLAPRMETE